MNQDKIKWLAENVMGWKPCTMYGGDGLPMYKYFSSGDNRFEGWNPYESWGDCGMLVEKCPHLVEISVRHDQTKCTTTVSKKAVLVGYSRIDYLEANKLSTAAISESIFQAMNGPSKLPEVK